jgi:hypothetical protein
MWYLFPQLGPWPLFIGVLPWLARLVATGYSGQRTPFDIPLLVFLVTAGTSLLAAYDPDGTRAVFPMPVGRRKLWGLMLSVLVYYSVAEFRTRPQRRWLLILLAGFGTAVALWFAATNDWGARPGLWDPIARLGRAIQSGLPYLPGHRLSPNVAGGLAALALPMGLELLSGVGWSYPKERAGASRVTSHNWLGWAAWGGVSTCVTGFGLLLSSSRGAWLGVAGALAMAGIWRLSGRLRRGLKRPIVFLALVAAATLVGFSAVVGIPLLRSTVLESQALANRLSISYQAVHLVRDYLFTGCGLGNFPFVHSTYVLLIHVPEMVFAHSTPLDVAVEQGMFAAVALAVVWVGAARIGVGRLTQSDEVPVGLRAGLLSLAVVIIHGAFDSTIYGSRALLLFWMPPALIVAASQSRVGGVAGAENQGADVPARPLPIPEGWASDGAGPTRTRGWLQLATLGTAVLVVVALLALFWRPLAASWYANLGAVHQTLVELRTYDYHHFDDPTLDEVRRREDLSQALASFERAVALDPGQVTARTRLAQIALARGEYGTGLQHALAAWEAGYRDRVTRLVLADALVADGRVEEAAVLVSGLEFARSRLQGQASSRYQQTGDWQRAAYAYRTVLALDPGNEQIRQAAERAEARATGE